jgi:tRNA A58 N-methylase Trm61
MKNPVYVMGHSEFELQRLERQDRLIGPSPSVYLQAAGIAPGMRVVDVGSGSGLVASGRQLVGPTGEVVGIDQRQPPSQRAPPPRRVHSQTYRFARVMPR